MTTTETRVAPWPGLAQPCPIWCDGTSHRADEMHGDRIHRSADPDFPVVSLTPDGDQPSAIYVYLRQHADDRAAHVNIEDDNAPGERSYSLTLTLDEAERLNKHLLDLVTQAVQGY